MTNSGIPGCCGGRLRASCGRSRVHGRLGRSGRYWTIPTLRETRATVDADVIVEAATYQEYAAFGKRLRERGFLQLAEDATPPYRWIKDDLILDVIPLDVRVLGFTNRWYRSGVTNAACAAWLRTDPRVTISRDTHYQLANRLAFPEEARQPRHLCGVT